MRAASRGTGGVNVFREERMPLQNGDGYLRKRIDVLLSAVDAMEGFAASRGRDFYSDINDRSRAKRQTARRDEGHSAPKRS